MILGVTAFKTEDKTEKKILFCQIKSTVCSFLTPCKCLVGFCFGICFKEDGKNFKTFSFKQTILMSVFFFT